MSRPVELDVSPEGMLLTDRVAVVTGAAQGIGEACAVALARFGAHVAICDREAEGLAATAADIEASGRRVVSAQLDVRDADAVDAFLATVEAEYGQPWEGGYSTNGIEATYLQLLGQGRLNFSLGIEDTSLLTEAEYGHVDVLVNNAGGTFFSAFLDVSSRGEAALIAENFTQVTHFIRRSVPLMGERGVPS